ncbi:MAG: Holliday junction branch migration protein RuvA [Rickettsiales bacterium]|jgi:Holliday junction DNA helicase RuvA
MIGKLKGIVEELDDDSLILDVGGVGYHVFVSSRLLAVLNIGEMTSLTIEMNVREDHIHLYGFPNKIERDWFRLLATVQGVGNKTGLAILAAYSPEKLVQAVMAKDIMAFKAISGIGPKLAERIVVELKDKVLKMPTSEFTTSSSSANHQPPATSHHNDAISALVNLGYSRSDAYGAINKIMQNAEENPAIDVLIRLGLKELG